MQSPFEAPIYAYATTSSTMDKARQLVREGAGHGTAVIAEMQTAGRGRVPGRKWTAAAGDALLCTVILNAAQLPHAPAPSLVIGYGVTEELSCHCPSARLQLKWPNDIFSNGRKLGGILCETIGSRYLLAGIGINIRNTPNEKDIRYPAACLHEHLPALDTATALLHVLNGIHTALHTPAAIIRTGIEQRLFHKGQKMQWSENTHRLPSLTGILIGIDTQGEALLQTDEGICRIASGELKPI